MISKTQLIFYALLANYYLIHTWCSCWFKFQVHINLQKSLVENILNLTSTILDQHNGHFKIDRIPKQLILHCIILPTLILDGVPGASFYNLQSSPSTASTYTKCTTHIRSVLFICIRFKCIICNTLTVQRIE